MSDKIRAPWTEAQVAALNAYQASGTMHPFTCGGDHDMHQTLIAEADGWHCPDEACDYRQDWAWAWMADPPERLPGAMEQIAILQAIAQPSLAAELAKTRQQLRATEFDLGKERQRTAELAARLQALQIHAAICRIEAAIPAPAAPVCGETLYTRPIDDVPTGGAL